MIGAIAGDIIGSRFEGNNTKTTDFPLFTNRCIFTDDTVLTVAIADSILHRTPYAEKLKAYYHRYPDAGYGAFFRRWAASPGSKPYNSWGNGSAMRVSPVGFAFNTLQQVLQEAKASAWVTHNHPHGIKGAQATASAIFLARTGSDKQSIKEFIESSFSYNLNQPLDEIRTYYTFDVSCQGSVPQALIAFLESENFEDAIRKAISIGGDSDTIACITGGIAQAYYGNIPDFIQNKVFEILDTHLGKICREFVTSYL